MEKNRSFRLAFLVSLVIFKTGFGISQTSFTSHTIDDNFNSPAGINAGDIDMDGDLDVVAGSAVNGVTLWKNLGGSPAQWAKQTIDNNSGVCFSVAVADIVRDGLPDIVAISNDKNQIYYYKNEGGEPRVWSKNVVASIEQPHEIFVCDFDMDGSQDIFAAGMSTSGEITWWRNNGGDPVQWTKQSISTNEPGARSVHVGDIDGDGDNDVAAAVFSTDEVTWWRNDGGSPVNWTKIVVANNFNGSHKIQIEDMDNDGDMDLVGTAFMANEIAIWSNDDGSGTTWTKHSVDNEFEGAVIGIAKDINSDGFMDIFGTAQDSHTVAWYKNKGLGDYGFKKYVLADNFDEVWPAYVGDIDNDMDLDLLAGGIVANEIRWWENKQAGRFTNKININNVPTNIGFFVPEEYNPEISYKAVVALHICGDQNEYSRYRDNLIPLCLEKDYILISPDCHNSINNLEVPDPEFILESLEYAKSKFNIDEDFIYLTGGSCNGRSALKHGLDNIYPFRGIIPFNPYLPDIPDSYYNFASDVPICFGVGTNDPSFNMAQEIFNTLMQEKGRAGFVSIPGVGHDFYIPQFTETMIECIRIIDSINDYSTGILMNNYQNEFNTYPNPFYHQVNLSVPQSGNQNMQIFLYDMQGREIMMKNMDFDSGKNPVKIDTSELGDFEGPMILSIIAGENRYNKRLIRSRSAH